MHVVCGGQLGVDGARPTVSKTGSIPPLTAAARADPRQVAIGVSGCAPHSAQEPS